jgi:hypothetical protein
LLQSKLRTGDQLGQDEALAFCAGIRLVLKQDFAAFNANVLARQAECVNENETPGFVN